MTVDDGYVNITLPFQEWDTPSPPISFPSLLHSVECVGNS